MLVLEDFMSREQYLNLQQDEQKLLDRLQQSPLCSKLIKALSKIQWKISLYENEANEVSLHLN